MNAIPLINNAPRPNINIGSIGSPAFNPVAADAKLGGSIGGNVMRQNPASMPVNNETQLRQEVNTSIIALKREAFSLENLIAQAAQTLQDINKRLSELEGKQDDYVKKADATVESVGGSGKYISAISETDGKISATATDLGNMVPVDTVTSGNMHSVTSNAVNEAFAYVSKFIIPIRMTYYSVSLTSYALYKLLGTGFKAYYDALPNVSGKTKNVRLVFNIYTQADNTITISLQKRNDTNYTEIYSGTVWGGMTESAYSNLVSAVIDPAFLNSHTSIFFKTSNSSYSVAIGFCFAEVYYE